MFTGPVPVQGPQASPGRRGLLAAAVPVSDEGLAGGREADEGLGGGPVQPAWANGFTFIGDACGALDPTLIECLPATDKGTLTNPDAVTYTPFLTYGADVCSTLDNGRDREARARRNLLATESWQIEREMFDGVASLAAPGSPGTDNPFLTDGNSTDVTGGAALASTLALAVMERNLVECLHGQRGMIHATPDLVTLWQAGGALRLEGDTILTVLDTIIVAGSGYSGNDRTGNAAAAGTTWAYGTGLVYLRQGIIYDPAATDPASRVDRAHNTTTWRYERPNAAYYSPCCVLAVHAALT